MYYTYVVRPGEAPTGRSPQLKPFWDACMDWNLRCGLLLQIVALVGLLIFGWIAGCGVGLISITSGCTRMTSSWGAVGAVICSLLWVGSACLIQGFRNTGDDEGSIKFARGYRAGTKLLNQATILDIIAGGMTTLSIFAQLSFLEDQWQTEAIKPNPMTIFNYTARLLHAISLIVYGAGFMFIESYHTTGTADVWGWILLSLYKTAGVLEFLAIVLHSAVLDLVFTVSLGLAVLSALMWAQAFEPIIISNEVQLDQSALRNEFFRSKNSMAYYGPQIDNNQEMVFSSSHQSSHR